MSQNEYLNEMGISTWVLKDKGQDSVEDKAEGEPSPVQVQQEVRQEQQPKASNANAAPTQVTQFNSDNQEVVWTFVVDQLSGDAALLFDKILASLMLSRNTIQLLSSAEALAGKVNGQVVIAMGSQMGRQLLQLDDGFEELRGAVHSLEQAEDELPLVLTYHPEHLLKKPSDKAKTWQDLLLARSLI
jgi:DNA polymerase III psi subunit